MENLRKRVKKLLIDHGFEYRGYQAELADKLGINQNSLNMALTGYRKNPGSEKILNDLLEFLQSRPKASNE